MTSPAARRRLSLLFSLLCGALVPGRVAAEPFTLAVAPDMQQERLRADDPRLHNRFEWLLAHRQELNLQALLGCGDFVNWDTPDHAQYERASDAVRLLEAGGLPSVFCLGNRDT